MKKRKKVLIWFIFFIFVAAFAGFAVQEIMANLPVVAKGGSMKLDPALLLSRRTWAYGGVVFVIFVIPIPPPDGTRLAASGICT
ncbi:MAG: hypothetical protein IJ733_05305, partial [Lachnospiraceae bacterium]|nr:hypothetical protein [Lachnospiraceae bacterium]